MEGGGLQELKSDLKLLSASNGLLLFLRLMLGMFAVSQSASKLLVVRKKEFI